MEERRISPLYRLIKALVRFFYPKTEIAGTENLPADEPWVIVGNHAQTHGPIVSELYIPGRHYTWCAGEMMELRAVPAYAYADFWSAKPRAVRRFYRLLSYLIAPLSVCIFRNAETIGVWHDSRIVTTFRGSVRRLQEGAGLVIFPEHAVPAGRILWEFRDKFVDVARFYYKKTGRELLFVPLYNAPALKTSYLGKPVRFRADAPIAGERARICGYLTEEIIRMAESLPVHTVVPYPNIAKKEYPLNIPDRGTDP